MSTPAPRAKENHKRYELELDACLTKATVRVRLQWNFESHLQPKHAHNVWTAKVAQANAQTPPKFMLGTDPADYKRNFKAAVLARWNTGTYYLEATAFPPPTPAGKVSRQCDPNPTYGTLGPGTPRRVDIEFDLPEATSGYHEDVEVIEDIWRYDPAEGRQLVHPLDGVIVDIYTEPWIVAHEFGHVIGHDDEYNPSAVPCSKWNIGCRISHWAQRVAVSDARYYNDTAALMNEGQPPHDQLRARYFGFVRDWVNKATDYRYMFQVRPHQNSWDEKFAEETPHSKTLKDKVAQGVQRVYERAGDERGTAGVDCYQGQIQVDAYHIYGADAKHLQKTTLAAGGKWRYEFPRQDRMVAKHSNRVVITGLDAAKSKYGIAMATFKGTRL